MKRCILFVLISCSISGCKEQLDYWQLNYPAEVEYQVELFKQYAPPNIKAKKLTIVLTGHGLRSRDGLLCAGLSSERDRKIYLDTTSSHWLNAKTALVLHELGHYVLDREHNNQNFTHRSNPGQPIPVSVMTTTHNVREGLIIENIVLQQYYLNELFYGH